MPSKRKICLVTYTHWDREFRWEFERTRMRLVDCLDHLLDLMEKKKDYRSFLFDGQATLLDDYLEIRPENRNRIRRLARANRLELGPWYTLPDCAAVQGETLIRNLQSGFRTALQFGPVLKCGYNVFSFGQIAQLPQIYDGFGIDTILFYKYMDPKRTKFSEFVWEAPDGTQALASRLGKEARWNFFFAGHIPIVHNRDPWHKNWQYRWGDFGKVFHTAGPDDYGWFYDILDPEISFHPENIRDGMERALKTVEGTAVPECVLLFEGTDFTEPHPLTPEILAEIRNQFGKEIDLVHGRLSDYLADLRKALTPRRHELDVVKGPMRDGPVGAVHSDVFSIHPEIMQLHGRVETALLNRVEPLGVFAWLNGVEQYPTTYLDKVWRLLFQSHVHDSVHGLGPRTLGAGVVGRLEQAEVIVKGLERRGLQNITKEIDTSKVTDTEFFVAVHNFSASERSEVVEAWLDLPREARVDHLIIEDEHGKRVADQQMEKLETRAGIYHPLNRNLPYYCTRVHAYFLAEAIPAMGYKTFRIKTAARAEYPYPHEDWEPPRIYADDLLRDARTAENEFLRVRVNGNGTLELTDKRTGEIYNDLNYFLDSGEIGNMWMSKEPHNNQLLDTRGLVASVSCRTHGPLVVAFDIGLDWKLPREFDRTRQARSKAEVAFPITVSIVLRKGCPYLEVAATIDNTAKDHYVKACFPTDSAAMRSWGEGSFTVDEFPVEPGSAAGMRGPALARHPAQMWFDVSDGKRGLAVLRETPCDYEVLEHDPRVTAAMSLVRCVPVRIPCDNRLWMDYPGDESAQSLRAFTYRYALLPHAGNWQKANLHQAALALRNPLQPCQFGRQKGTLPLSRSFLSLDGDTLVLSTFKKADGRDSVIVRFYNPSNKDTKAVLRPGFAVTKAWLVNLNEDRLKALKVTKAGISIPVGHGKIMSVELAR